MDWFTYSTYHPSWCMECVLQDYRAKIPLERAESRKCRHMEDSPFRIIKKETPSIDYPLPFLFDKEEKN
jgi:hypothetical protein